MYLWTSPPILVSICAIALTACSHPHAQSGANVAPPRAAVKVAQARRSCTAATAPQGYGVTRCHTLAAEDRRSPVDQGEGCFQRTRKSVTAEDCMPRMASNS